MIQNRYVRLSLLLGGLPLLFAGWGYFLRGTVPWDTVPSSLHPVVSSGHGVKGIDVRERRDSQCASAYEAFYRPRVLEFYVVFGYKDARPARLVGDRYEKAAFIESLTKACPRGFHACGFRRSSADPSLLIKEIQGPEMAMRRIHLRVIHSSVGPDDEINRQNPFQKWQSKHAELKFAEGLKTADAVFYYGHSRDGGGPDFEPPKLRADGHPHYWWYEHQKPGLKELVRNLKLDENRPKILGLFSCVSTDLFEAEISKAQPKLALITSSELLYYIHALKSMLGALSSLLGMSCQSEFENAIQTGATREISTKLKGFFQTKTN